jgi:hypothetical protein
MFAVLKIFPKVAFRLVTKVNIKENVMCNVRACACVRVAGSEMRDCK